jgi:hypothetical protein
MKPTRATDIALGNLLVVTKRFIRSVKKRRPIIPRGQQVYRAQLALAGLCIACGVYIMTIAALMAELRAAEDRNKKAQAAAKAGVITGDTLDLEDDIMLETQARIAKAISDAHSESIGDLQLKFELLPHWKSMAEGWIDDRDTVLTESIRANFARFANRE